MFHFLDHLKFIKSAEAPRLVIMLELAFTLGQSFTDYLFKLDSELKIKFLGRSMLTFISGFAKLQLASFIPDLNLTSMNEIGM